VNNSKRNQILLTITDNISIVADELKLTARQVQATADLLNEGGTVPFIARYRKEATNSLDEVQVLAIRDRLAQLADLDKRRDAILKSLEERSLLTEELKKSVAAAKNMVELEDIYLPFRPKRRTKAMAAKEKGLEPLAQQIFDCVLDNPKKTAEGFISDEKGVASSDEALSGARDIIAEWASPAATRRSAVQEISLPNGSTRINKYEIKRATIGHAKAT
jgi:protein Tex